MAMSPSPQMHFPQCKQGGWQSPPSRSFCTPWYPTDSFKFLTWVPELLAADPLQQSQLKPQGLSLRARDNSVSFLQPQHHCVSCPLYPNPPLIT